MDFPCGSDNKESSQNVGDPGSIPRMGRSPGEGNGYPLQYFCVENSMNRGAWQATVHGSQRVGHNWMTNFSLNVWYDQYFFKMSLFWNWPDLIFSMQWMVYWFPTWTRLMKYLLSLMDGICFLLKKKGNISIGAFVIHFLTYQVVQ